MWKQSAKRGYQFSWLSGSWAAEAAVDEYPLQGSSVVSRHLLKHPIDHKDVEVHMTVQAGTETVDEGHRTDLQSTPSHIRRTGAVVPQALRNDPQKNTQHHALLSLVKVTLYETPKCWAELEG